MAALSSLPHRHGMVYHEQDDSSSGEFSAVVAGVAGALGDTRPSDNRSPHCRTAAESEDSYEEIYTSSSSSEDSYHSECDDIAEYWDPYCKLAGCMVHSGYLLTLHNMFNTLQL